MSSALAMPDVSTFRVVVAPSSITARVDRAAKIIRGIAVMQLGPLHEADPRSWVVDEVTLDQLLNLASQQPDGVRSHFEHKSDADDGLARHLGRFHNFRKNGSRSAVIADLHLADVSFRGAAYGSHVMDRAEEDPASFGASIVARNDFAAMGRATGRDGRQPIRLKSLFFVDVVDIGAATPSGLFADAQFSVGGKLPGQQLVDAVMTLSAASPGCNLVAGMSHDDVFALLSVADDVREYFASVADFRRCGFSLADHVMSEVHDREGCHFHGTVGAERHRQLQATLEKAEAAIAAKLGALPGTGW